ncbi:hypothetical protein [Cardiobacterium hominis]|uniref:hypothetical protein n=1 Tax=Cardiobacterium hominis TaxID=2718 RepID=UPI0014756A86|nr:hypothetical protein [Cardiobacterium hominis]
MPTIRFRYRPAKARKRYLPEKFYAISANGFASMRQYRDFVAELRKRADAARF